MSRLGSDREQRHNHKTRKGRQVTQPSPGPKEKLIYQRFSRGNVNRPWFTGDAVS